VPFRDGQLSHHDMQTRYQIRRDRESLRLGMHDADQARLVDVRDDSGFGDEVFNTVELVFWEAIWRGAQEKLEGWGGDQRGDDHHERDGAE
jgi:hypothetical protein